MTLTAPNPTPIKGAGRLAPPGMALIGAAVLVLLAVAVALAPWLAPYGPAAVSGRPFTPPGGMHLLGTDDLGHDVFSQLLYGGRVSLGIAGTVALLSTATAWTLGVAAGLWRRAEEVVIALADLLLALPHLPLAMLVLLLAGPGVGSLTLTLVALNWPAFARLVRAQVLSVRRAPYVQAARALGAREGHIARRHVVPATLSLLPATLILTVRAALFAEATLAFLGLGDPARPSWGTMLSWAFNDPLLFARQAWLWWTIPPALSIALTVLATSWLVAGLEPLKSRSH